MGKKSRQKMTGLTEVERFHRKIERNKKLKELTELIREKLKDPQARAELIAAIETSKGRMTKEQLLKALGEMKGESAKD